MGLEIIIIVILVILLIIVMSGHIYIIETKTNQNTSQTPSETNFSYCHGDPYGCCPNTQIPKLNVFGSNCR